MVFELSSLSSLSPLSVRFRSFRILVFLVSNVFNVIVGLFLSLFLSPYWLRCRRPYARFVVVNFILSLLSRKLLSLVKEEKLP